MKSSTHHFWSIHADRDRISSGPVYRDLIFYSAVVLHGASCCLDFKRRDSNTVLSPRETIVAEL